MRRIWTYLVVVLCACMTSARVLDLPGNRNGLRDNLFSTSGNEKVLTPPSDGGLIIDSDGYPGNSNEQNIKEMNPKDSPTIFDEIINAILSETNQSDDYNIIPFTKEDIIQLENSDICKNMCMNNIRKTPCNCEEEN